MKKSAYYIYGRNNYMKKRAHIYCGDPQKLDLKA